MIHREGMIVGYIYGLREAAHRRHILFGYDKFDSYTVKVLYKNMVTEAYREYIILSDEPIPDELLDEARMISDRLYSELNVNAPIPNVPLYALIYLLMRHMRGLSYRCKIVKDNCPLRILRLEKGEMRSMSVQSLIEQMYRVFKKHPITAPLLRVR
jgi:hypothetical protein